MNLDPEKLFIIGMLALLVLGPKRLPRVAHDAGKAIAHLRQLSASLQAEVHQTLGEPTQVLRDAVGEFTIDAPSSSLHDSVAAVFRPTPGRPSLAALEPVYPAVKAPTGPDQLGAGRAWVPASTEPDRKDPM
jgi:Sec-independent protein translocase protein TatA